MSDAKEIKTVIVETKPEVIVSSDEKKDVPLYVALKLSGEKTEQVVASSGIEKAKYSVVRGLKDPAHVTLVFYKDIQPRLKYVEYVEENYHSKVGKEISFQVVAFYVDKYCVACKVELKEDLAFFPADKNLHVTLMLNGKAPVYSNELIGRLNQKEYQLAEGEQILKPEEPLVFSGVLELVGKLWDN